LRGGCPALPGSGRAKTRRFLPSGENSWPSKEELARLEIPEDEREKRRRTQIETWLDAALGDATRLHRERGFAGSAGLPPRNGGSVAPSAVAGQKPRAPRFWQPADYRDRFTRDERHFAATMEYLHNNLPPSVLCPPPSALRPLSSVTCHLSPVTRHPSPVTRHPPPEAPAARHKRRCAAVLPGP
jgi:hypothetical protein